jgi:protein SCO1
MRLPGFHSTPPKTTRAGGLSKRAARISWTPDSSPEGGPIENAAQFKAFRRARGYRPMTVQASIWSVAAVLSACAVGFGASRLWGNPSPPTTLVAGLYLPSPRALPKFELLDMHGHAFGSDQLLGHWSLLVFGYTNCPNYCPATLTTLSALHKRLRAESVDEMPTVVFMSMDAKRDTPEHLAQYVPYFDPDFVATTASDQASIESVARGLGVNVIVEPGENGNYTVDHSSSIYVVQPDGKLVAILNGPFSLDALQTDIQRIVGKGRSALNNLSLDDRRSPSSSLTFRVKHV